jgi:hypothetical protein
MPGSDLLGYESLRQAGDETRRVNCITSCCFDLHQIRFRERESETT